MRTYIGVRTKDGVKITVDDKPLALEPSLILRQHSPTGFEWGYIGSGPAQLALAILLNYFGGGGENKSLELYKEFKHDFVRGFKNDGFALSGDTISSWVTEQEKDKALGIQIEEFHQDTVVGKWVVYRESRIFFLGTEDEALKTLKTLEEEYDMRLLKVCLLRDFGDKCFSYGKQLGSYSYD